MSKKIEDEKLKQISEVFDKRLRGGEFPPFYPFRDKGDSVIGRIVGSHESQFSTKENPMTIFHIRTFDGEEYSLPTSTVAMSLYQQLNVQIGDYIKMIYQGEAPSKRGRPVKTYLLAKLSAEEFEKLFPDKKIPLELIDISKKQIDEKAVIEKIQKDYTALSQAGVLGEEQIIQILADKYSIDKNRIKEYIKSLTSSSTEAPTMFTPAVTAEKHEEIKKFFKDVLNFYDEITYEQAEEIIKNAGYEISISDLLKICKEFATSDDTQKIIRKK